MRILIAGSVMSNEGYEEERLVRGLEKELKKNHTTDAFLLPFTRNFLTLPEQILACTLLDASECDMLITVGYPACMIEHNKKVAYLFDAAPHFWEYWDSQYGVLCNNQYLNIRDTVNKIDKKILSKADKVVCGSKLLSDDINKRLDIKTETMYCPAFDFDESDNENDKKYILAESELLPLQRPEVLIEAAKKLNDYKLKLFVPNADIVYKETFEKWVCSEGLQEKIKVLYRPAGTEDYNNASAYITSDFEARRIPNSLIKAVNAEVPVFFAQDCGAETEILKGYGLKIAFSADKCENITDKNIVYMGKNNSGAFKSEDISSFAERLAEL